MWDSDEKFVTHTYIYLFAHTQTYLPAESPTVPKQPKPNNVTSRTHMIHIPNTTSIHIMMHTFKHNFGV